MNPETETREENIRKTFLSKFGKPVVDRFEQQGVFDLITKQEHIYETTSEWLVGHIHLVERLQTFVEIDKMEEAVNKKLSDYENHFKSIRKKLLEINNHFESGENTSFVEPLALINKKMTVEKELVLKKIDHIRDLLKQTKHTIKNLLTDNHFEELFPIKWVLRPPLRFTKRYWAGKNPGEGEGVVSNGRSMGFIQNERILESLEQFGVASESIISCINQFILSLDKLEYLEVLNNLAHQIERKWQAFQVQRAELDAKFSKLQDQQQTERYAYEEIALILAVMRHEVAKEEARVRRKLKDMRGEVKKQNHARTQSFWK